MTCFPTTGKVVNNNPFPSNTTWRALFISAGTRKIEGGGCAVNPLMQMQTNCGSPYTPYSLHVFLGEGLFLFDLSAHFGGDDVTGERKLIMLRKFRSPGGLATVLRS